MEAAVPKKLRMTRALEADLEGANHGRRSWGQDDDAVGEEYCLFDAVGDEKRRDPQASPDCL
jgi:hypothetical protein